MTLAQAGEIAENTDAEKRGNQLPSLNRRPAVNDLASLAPIFALEAHILKQPQVEMPIKEDFCDGLYARTLILPAGTLATGAIHRGESFFTVRKGTLAVATNGGPKIMNGGDMAVTKAGMKRAVVAITDVEITTFHANPTNEHDQAKLWELYTIPAPALPLGRVEELQ